MKFLRHSFRISFVLFLLLSIVAACAPSKPSGAPKRKKNKNHKKCNCPKWTNNTEAHKKTAHPYA